MHIASYYRRKNQMDETAPTTFDTLKSNSRIESADFIGRVN